MTNKLERRAFDLKEFRAETFEDKKRFVGYAAVFNRVDGPANFREQIAPGAFLESIEKDDIRALINHDPNLVLGRNKAGTLMLREDEIGLATVIFPPPTQYANDLQLLVSRGEVSGMSFGMEVIEEKWDKGLNGEPDLRTILKAKLWDVSIVTFPFYGDTVVASRSHDAWLEEQKKESLVVEAKDDSEVRKPEDHKLQIKKSYLSLKSKI